MLYDFLRQLYYRLSMDILQSLHEWYVYDPSFMKKCNRKDQPVVEMPIFNICTGQKRNTHTHAHTYTYTLARIHTHTHTHTQKSEK